jgi:hypothetical protein
VGKLVCKGKDTYKGCAFDVNGTTNVVLKSNYTAMLNYIAHILPFQAFTVDPANSLFFISKKKNLV